MNNDTQIPDDTSALMLYLADELPMGLRHEMEVRLANEPALSKALDELKNLEHDVHKLMDAPLAGASSEAAVLRTMAAIRRQAMASARTESVDTGKRFEEGRKRRRFMVLGYSAFAVAACLVLALGLWTMGLFGSESESIPNKGNHGQLPPDAVVGAGSEFWGMVETDETRLNQASEHWRELQQDKLDNDWLMMM